MDGWVDGRMEGWMDGWMDGLGDGCVVVYVPASSISAHEANLQNHT